MVCHRGDFISRATEGYNLTNLKETGRAETNKPIAPRTKTPTQKILIALKRHLGTTAESWKGKGYLMTIVARRKAGYPQT